MTVTRISFSTFDFTDIKEGSETTNKLRNVQGVRESPCNGTDGRNKKQHQQHLCLRLTQTTGRLSRDRLVSGLVSRDVGT